MENSPVVACREIFDENSQPSQEEITDYAHHIGIDPVSEGHLLPLAKDGLMQALPAPWKAYLDEKLKTHYYYNPDSGVTQWEHPLDRVYRHLVVKARTASDKDVSIHTDTCASVQELLTFEENSKQVEKSEVKADSPEEEFSTDSDESKSDLKHKAEAAIKKPTVPAQRPTALAPIANRPMTGLSPLIGISDRKLSDLRASPLRRSIDSSFPVKTGQRDSYFRGKDPDFPQGDSRMKGKAMFEKPPLYKQHSEIIDLRIKLGDRQDDGSFGLVQSRSDKGISFTGKGSMFLKTKRGGSGSGSGLPSPDTEKSLPFDASTKSEPPKGILREKTFELLERKLEAQKLEMKNAQTSIDDDKKSVRFNLEQKETEVPHEFSLSPSSNSSSDQQDKQSSIISNIGASPKVLDPPAAKISNENLAELPPRPTRSLKLAPIGKPGSAEGRKVAVDIPREPPMRPKMWTKQDTIDLEDKLESHSQGSTDRSDSKRETDRSPQGKRLLKPPAGDFIKPNLFQKQFDKIADIIKPMSLDTDSESEFKGRPRSPMIPQKNKISINLMESIESETSIDSPDKELAALDLNDISEPIQPKMDTDSKPKLSLKLNDVKVCSPTLNSPTLRINQEKKTRIQQMELNIEGELKKLNQDLEQRRSTEEQRLREEMEEHLKKIKVDIFREQEVETDKLKARLKEQHESHKAEIEKAISNAQEQHKLSLQHVMDNIQLKLEGEREDTIRKEQERQREEIDEIIMNMERDHNDNVLKLHEEKAEELSRIRKKLELDNARAVREMRETLSAGLEVERAKQLSENRSALEKLKADHDALCDEIRKDYRSEVELLRSQHSCHLAELRSRLAGEREAERRRRAETGGGGADNDKRQLEDKYRCLKEKYARLKSDVKMSIERRNKRREQSMTTGSETEKSNSNKAAQTLEKSKELNDPSIVMSTKSEPVGGIRGAANNNPVIRYQHDNDRQKADNNNTSDTEIKERPSKMHLGVTSKNGNVSDLSSDLSRSKSPNIHDKSPIGKLMSREHDKYKNSTDNELSLGLNDTSLSQSESHTVSKGKNKLTVAFSSDVDKTTTKKEKSVKKVHAQVHTDKAATDYHDSSDTANSEKKAKESTHGRSRKKSFTRLKSASTSRLNYSPKRGDRSCSPVENLRQQLRKLEDLEEQFPDLTLNVDSAGYRLRYPFADLGVVGRGVPELEFVAHRALVEREGVRRARASLRRRRAALRDRRRRLSTSATSAHPDQTWQEERDLTDLEVSLHRTRAMLGEKVIRLRHIEKTLRKMANGSSDDTSPDKAERPEKVHRKDDKQDTTLSDISSQSSGFSSTEGQSDTNIRQVLKREVSGVTIYEQSTEIINSLENLNTEIRDIWQVLNIQQRQNIAKVIPPGQVLYSDLNFPILGVGSVTSHQRIVNPPGPIPGMSTVPISTGLSAIPSDTIGTMGTSGGHAVIPGLHNIPTLADRLHTYRQLTNQRQPGLATVVTTSGATVPGGVATSLVERTKDLRDWLRQQASL